VVHSRPNDLTRNSVGEKIRMHETGELNPGVPEVNYRARTTSRGGLVRYSVSNAIAGTTGDGSCECRAFSAHFDGATENLKTVDRI
jgi:hypothetical protein